MMKKIIYLAAAIALLANITACQDDLGITPQPQPGEEVTVSLSLGFADEEDGFTVSASDTRTDRSKQKGSFDAQLTPTVHTRAVASKPDALYELRILQYDLNGVLKKIQTIAGGTQIGTSLSISLNQMDDCQLVILACGKDNATLTKTITEGTNISALQNLTLTKAYFDAIPADGSATTEQMNKMPYILHLPHVKVTATGIQSVEGAHDARLLLKRLAAKLTLVWNNNLNTSDGYVFKEVKLCQIPSVFRLLPAPTKTQWGMAYPSVVAEYIEYYRLTDADLAAGNTKTVWIPANVRGTSPASSTDNYRTKANAPDAASYAEIVVDNSVKNERLFYRAYLGGDDPRDFNLRENTDYAWTLNINSTNYRGDARIQLLDQTPVKSTNEVPTSNCFMMQPGTNICFNPYKHEAGTGGWNTYLTNGSTLAAEKTITSVKVLWQNKDAGTSGDLVMGYAIDDNNHINLVNYTDIDNLEKARVHIKVPVTQGGNAVVAAYHNNVIIWSWHIWISDYVPATVIAANIVSDDTRKTAIAAARSATLGGSVHAYLGTAWTNSSGAFFRKVIMDRNIGAIRATYSNDNDLDAARAYGYLYQWGRKDPIPGSVDGTANEIGVIYDGDGRGVDINKVSKASDPLIQSIQNPISFIIEMDDLGANSWGGGDGSAKTIYDPCPIGWRVPDFTTDVNKNMFQGMAMGTNTEAWVKGEWFSEPFSESQEYYDVKNGFLYNKEVWLPTFRLREIDGDLRDPFKSGSFDSRLIPSYGVWGASQSKPGVAWYMESKVRINSEPNGIVATKAYGFGVRCIQE